MPYAVNAPFSCPSCNRLLTFRSEQTAWLICVHCRELIEKQERIHQSYQVPAMPEDLSPIQIETRAMIDLQFTEAIGRIRLQYADGYLNLWALHTPQQTLSWMAESFGTYVLGKCLVIPGLYGRLLGEEAGTPISLSPDLSFTIDHIQDCIDWDREGELPEFDNEMRFSQHYEMSTPTGECAFAWRTGQTDAVVIVGQSHPFDYFSFTNLRALNDWL